ncbi:MAG: glutathione S-transferase family protein [Proteobacteria bacterium]|nr:MAG: glutathione S-transferase family protein [Pseudomonadota bacterium]
MKQTRSTPTITAFKNSPDRGRGLARDFRVRWALEELEMPYEVQLVTFEDMKQPEYIALQPFSQIPAYKEDDLVLFESGAIILHIADTDARLLPQDPRQKAKAISWMFASLNTVEPPIVERSFLTMFDKDKSYYQERLATLDERVHTRLKQLSERLEDNEWLEANFTAGDLLMVTVLRRLDSSGLLKSHPKLEAYILRAEARPAYQRAFAAQLAVYENARSDGKA